jgi:hypothetical protein
MLKKRPPRASDLKRSLIVAASLCLGSGFAAPAPGANAPPGSAATPSPFPLQLEMRVPFAPTAFPSLKQSYLAYELYITNFSADAMDLRRVEVLNANDSTTPIATFEGKEFESLLQPVGANTRGGEASPRRLGAGDTVIVFMWIPFKHAALIPVHLIHRVFSGDSSIEGTVVDTHRTVPHVLCPPVEGAGWLADDGPSNDRDNHHRRGYLIIDGHPVISRRYAIDWEQVEQGARYSGDEHDKSSYYSYGKPVLSVADATVVTARDGLPDNAPGHGEAFHPAAPITIDTVGGNTVILDLGGGQFAYYFHLQPGSLHVKPGDHVRRGQVLARIGSSGDAREPHLHFEVTTSAKMMAGEGVPYLITQYRVRTTDEPAQLRTRELPMRGMLVDFMACGRQRAVSGPRSLSDERPAPHGLR